MNLQVKRVGKFHFYNDWPDTVLSDVLSCLQPMEWLLPPWCQVCVLFWDGRNPNAIATSRLDFDYRRFNIWFAPQWLQCDEREKKESIIHELVHAHNLTIAEYARVELERLLPQDPNHRASVLEALKIRVEQSTCDLTFCLLEHLHGPSQ